MTNQINMHPSLHQIGSQSLNLGFLDTWAPDVIAPFQSEASLRDLNFLAQIQDLIPAQGHLCLLLLLGLPLPCAVEGG